MTSAGELLAAVAKEQERDSLGDIARRERKGLLAASLVALATSWGDLIPNKIEALGLTVEELDQGKLLLLLAFVLGSLQGHRGQGHDSQDGQSSP